MNELSIEEINSLLSNSVVDRIEAMESAMIQCEQVEIQVKSFSLNGMYAREILIPKGTLLTGRVHLFDYVDIMLSGDITVATDEGAKRFTGDNVFQGVAGRKRAGYAHEDTRWITVHNTEITDDDDFYNVLTAQTVSDYNDRKDYLSLLGDYGFKQDDIDEVVQNELDMIDVDDIPVYVNESLLNGKGLFSRKSFIGGEYICNSSIGGHRTIAGRYSNHSIKPNAEMIFNGKDWLLMALEYIDDNQEITTNYRNTLSIRGAICQQ